RIVIPAGRYLIDAEKMISIPSNREIVWEDGAVFEVIPNSSSHYRVINISRADNIVLRSPQIVGDRLRHKGTAGEHGHGIVISGGKNVRIYDANISRCWGDGIAIYEGVDVDIENLVSDNNRRMGLTI